MEKPVNRKVRAPMSQPPWISTRLCDHVLNIPFNEDHGFYPTIPKFDNMLILKHDSRSGLEGIHRAASQFKVMGVLLLGL